MARLHEYNKWDKLEDSDDDVADLPRVIDKDAFNSSTALDSDGGNSKRPKLHCGWSWSRKSELGCLEASAAWTSHLSAG